MECNREEAVRAKELAEKKFEEKNYAIAKKFALKAQSLYPELEGISQMLPVLDIYASVENKISGEVDWYGILSVTPYAEDEIIRKQYRKLAFMLHPDKNKSLGAEGAFKLVSEAWSLLSDKAKRLAYNQKRNLKGFQQGFPSRNGGPSVQPNENTFQNVMNSATSNARAHQGVPSCTGGPSVQPCANTFQNVMSSVTSNCRGHHGPTRGSAPGLAPGPAPGHAPGPAPGHAPLPSHGTTFWTICNQCKTHYQYLRCYLNHVLICPNCQKAFMAVEHAPPPNLFKSSSSSSSRKHQNSRHHAASGNSFSFGRNCGTAQNLGAGGSLGKTNFQQDSISKMTSLGSKVASGNAAAPDVCSGASEKVKREQERRQSIAEWERSKNLMGNPSLKKRRMDDKNLNGREGYMPNKMAMKNDGADLGGVSEVSTGNVGTKRIYGFSSTYTRTNVARELPYPEMKKILIKKAQTEICKILEVKANKEQEKVKVNKKHKSVVDVDSTGDSDTDTNEDVESAMSINVPDPDFHNFDLDRTESSFGEDEVWAAYDNDGMPRFYARIHKVISLKPFKMRISWLNTRSNSELGPINWVGSGFTKTCGDFRIGKHEISGTINSFSNKVSWTKGTRGAIRIYPRRKEVWAQYRNWSSDWNQHTAAAVINKYDMVEVLDDFTEEHGVSVVPLSKVAGFRTVFRKDMDPKEVRKIPKEEMFRFSHQVPSHLLTGEEAQNAPKGCWELDPAATPSELLQVITEADVENGGRTKEENFQSASTGEVDGGIEKEGFQKMVNKPMTTDNGACQVGEGNRC